MLDWLGVPMITRGDAYTLPDELRILYPFLRLVCELTFWTHDIIRILSHSAV